MRLKAAWILPALMALASPAMAIPFDVTIGATVTATGAIGNSTNGAWADPAPAALSTITDGLYVPEGTNWQEGTVWWNENPDAAGAPSPALNNIIEIDLNGLFLINFLSVQADNNDFYGISVRDQFGVWNGLTNALPFGGPGMRERSGFFVPFLATGFRVDAFNSDGFGDGYYSLSEFRAVGERVPEPASLLLFGTSAVGLLLARRRRQR